MVQRLFFEATRNRYQALCTYACLYREAAQGQVVRTSFIQLKVRQGTLGPLDRMVQDILDHMRVMGGN